jgi:hypothetical protein
MLTAIILIMKLLTVEHYILDAIEGGMQLEEANDRTANTIEQLETKEILSD